MVNKTIIIVSGQVDATIREYQPDVEFLIFRTIRDLSDHVEKNPIRAQTLFFTKDVVGTTNSSFSYLHKLVSENDYLHVDRVVYITEVNSDDLVSFNYLCDEFELENWESIEGSMSRAFITEVINGTFREDRFNSKRKAVYRTPRADYVKQQLRNKDSLDEEYLDDEKDLGGIPDEELPPLEIPEHVDTLSRVYIAGNEGFERSVFTFLAAQYLSLTNKVLLVESDPDYHTITEFSTKSGVDAYRVSVTQLYEDVATAIEAIRNAPSNLVILEAIDRIDFNYKYICSLLFYNLSEDFDYLMYEMTLDEIPSNTPVTVTVPSTVLGVLQTAEKIDKSLIDKCRFIGINIKQLPELHINSGVVMSTLLDDLLSTQNIICPVITVSTLKLSGTAYDLGAILGKGIIS